MPFMHEHPSFFGCDVELIDKLEVCMFCSNAEQKTNSIEVNVSASKDISGKIPADPAGEYCYRISI